MKSKMIRLLQVTICDLLPKEDPAKHLRNGNHLLQM